MDAYDPEGASGVTDPSTGVILFLTGGMSGVCCHATSAFNESLSWKHPELKRVAGFSGHTYQPSGALLTVAFYPQPQEAKLKSIVVQEAKNVTPVRKRAT